MLDLVCVIVVLPPFASEFVPRIEIEAPDVFLARQLFVHIERFSADPDQYSWMPVALWQLVDSVLEVVLVHVGSQAGERVFYCFLAFVTEVIDVNFFLFFYSFWFIYPLDRLLRYDNSKLIGCCC